MLALNRPAISHCHTSLEGQANYGGPELSMSLSRQDEASAQPPSGFPLLIQNPTVWSGEDDVAFKLQTLELGAAEVAEVGRALKHFLSMHKTQHIFQIPCKVLKEANSF